MMQIEIRYSFLKFNGPFLKVTIEFPRFIDHVLSYIENLENELGKKSSLEYQAKS